VKHLVPVLTLLFVLPTEGDLLAQNKLILPPLRLNLPFEAAWNGILLTLQENEFELLTENRGKGSILSSFREYSSGPLTASHIDKIGETPKLVDGEWVSVKYQYEILVELIAERETVLTVYANIEALKREFLGTEEWITIETFGKLEAQLLTQFGKTLFGQAFDLPEPKKGYRDRDPVYVPNPVERIPPVVGPERIP
jgi:hypothetical protein